ncbi:hypothetical protein [Rouxiella badensis]|uniref:hypothetical protein n=1 Tax=Rouxiella badensis TaxID=1646377 RepID=UPI003C47F237
MSDKISDARLNRVREILEWFKGDYEGVEEDQENFEAMRDAMVAIDEVLSRRTTEVKPVVLPDINSPEYRFHRVFRRHRYYRDVEKAIKAAGVTVEGDIENTTY